MKNLPKNFNPAEHEDEIYRKWETSGFFNPDTLEAANDRFWKADHFSIPMPPPNITGELHIGHAMMLTIEDIMTRHARMSGKKTLWLPGTDHAAIATQNVVEKKVWQTEKKTRHELGRAELLRRIDEFVTQTKGKIQSQIRKLGSSCDWSREKYTLSPELSLAVRTVFFNMYKQGLIYRGDRIVNWCTRCGTTLADDEVLYEERPGQLYYISYPLSEGHGEVTVATTRPETMLGDTAVAVNPKDRRYKKLINQKVMLPLVNRELPIIADDLVDMNFGTGVLKVTPGHDANDFEIGQRHKLPSINLLTPEGKISPKEALDFGFEEYSGLTMPEVREKIVKALEENGFLKKTESIKHNVGLCYRCGTMIEPIISKQWFVDVNKKIAVDSKDFRKTLGLKEKSSLKDIALAAVKSGAIQIVPERFGKVYVNWIENLRDWNISRQIWFGHRIPVWYCNECEEVIVSIMDPPACSTCGSGDLRQDEDTLDTWFSSSLWTFSTLGWPEKTEDLKNYHPADVLETGYDILFFWVARMIIMTGFSLQNIPFRTIYLHGLVRDREGKKMSKSLGNVINPLDIINRFGADALRLALVLGNTPGNDIRVYPEKIESHKNLINKIWNIARYILTREDQKSDPAPAETLADQWITSELNTLIAKMEKLFLTYQYGLAGEELHDFTWNKFADWYLEISKIETGNNKNTLLRHILSELLKLWHPFIPFVTEAIWGNIYNSLLLAEEYPAAEKTPTRSKAVRDFETIQELITGIRSLRNEYRVEPAKIIAAYVNADKPHLKLAQEQTAVVERLARVKLNFSPVPPEKKLPSFNWKGGKTVLVIPLFDPAKERERAEKELAAIEKNLSKISEQIKNRGFLKKAPKEIVQKLKEQHDSIKEQQKKLQEKIAFLD